VKLVFGWHLDGPTYPLTVNGLNAEFNAAVLGPSGLLSALENELGLVYPDVHHSRRTAQYLARLRYFDDSNQFYLKSFSHDQWGVADYLLQARDTLVLHGWRGKSALSDVGRLSVFKRIEAQDSIELSPGFCERFTEVLASLKNSKQIDIAELAEAVARRR
jgi:hypothetical protein